MYFGSGLHCTPCSHTRNLTGGPRQGPCGECYPGCSIRLLGSPRPYIVIDMSAPATDDNANEAATSGLTILNDAGLKARLLRMIVGDAAFRSGKVI